MSEDFAVLPRTDLIIGEERLATASGGSWDHIFPVTGRPSVSLPLAGADEVDRAVAAAQEGQKAWTKMGPEGRRDALLKLAALTAEWDVELSAISAIETGVGARKYGEICAETIVYYAGWAEKIGGEVVTGGIGHGFDYTLYEPFGVVGVIVPWNAPLIAMTNVVAPALAAGNAVVIKPSEMAPFSCIRWGELCVQAGIPAGVVNVIPGGKDAGEALVGHPGVNFIHFTGSTPVGKAIARAAADNLTPVSLELGGRSANLVFEDGDLELSVRMAFTALVALNGQACTAAARILVQRSIYDSFVEKLVAMVRSIKPGDPRVKGNGIGPVINESAVSRITSMIEQAIGEGATLATGGKRVEGTLDGGFFVEPTVLIDVPPHAHISKNEVFGPVVIVTPFDTDEEAVALANATPYGLAGYVQTASLKRAHRVAAALRCGMVYINGGLRAHPTGAPFGGRGHSGYGRVGGRMGVEEFMHKKNVWLAL